MMELINLQQRPSERSRSAPLPQIRYIPQLWCRNGNPWCPYWYRCTYTSTINTWSCNSTKTRSNYKSMFPGRGRHVNLLIGQEPVPSKHSSRTGAMITTATAYRTWKIVWSDIGRCRVFLACLYDCTMKDSELEGPRVFGKPPLASCLWFSLENNYIYPSKVVFHGWKCSIFFSKINFV